MDTDIQVKKSRLTRRRIIVLATLCVALIALGWLFYLALSSTAVGGMLGLKPPLWLFESRYIEVMNDITTGTATKSKAGPFSLVDYADFVVQLPPAHQKLTPLGIVFAEERSDGRWFVIFPTSHGFHHDLMGYLYCSEPLTPEDFEINSGSGFEAVMVCGQALQVTHITGPWYSVDRGFD
jgi:hypothetical protein